MFHVLAFEAGLHRACMIVSVHTALISSLRWRSLGIEHIRQTCWTCIILLHSSWECSRQRLQVTRLHIDGTLLACCHSWDAHCGLMAYLCSREGCWRGYTVCILRKVRWVRADLHDWGGHGSSVGLLLLELWSCFIVCELVKVFRAHAAHLCDFHIVWFIYAQHVFREILILKYRRHGRFGSHCRHFALIAARLALADDFSTSAIKEVVHDLELLPL